MVANVRNILGLSMSASQKKCPVANVVLRVTDRQICNDFFAKGTLPKTIALVASRYSSVFSCIQNCSKLIQCSLQVLCVRW